MTTASKHRVRSTGLIGGCSASEVAVVVATSLLTVACGTTSNGPDAEAASCDAGAEEGLTFLVSSIRIGEQVTPETGYGVDVDGVVTLEGDASGCGHRDFMAPAPFGFSGVDNQFGPVLRVYSEARAQESMDIGIQEGRILFVFELVTESDSEGSCVELRWYEGQLPTGVDSPVLAPDGTLERDQTIDVLASSFVDGAPAHVAHGTRRDGWIDVRAEELPFQLATEARRGKVQLDGPRVLLRPDPTGVVTMALGGGMPTETAADWLCPDYVVCSSAQSIVESVADLDECESISIGFVLQAVPVSVGEVR